jgi:hypothetical protein
MTEREALMLALEALEILYNDSELMVTHRQHKGMKNAITAIKEALAQPEPTAIGKLIANEEAYWRNEMLSGD